MAKAILRTKKKPVPTPAPEGVPQAGDLVLSVRQPLASALFDGTQAVEHRSWPTRHRGRIWIHATGSKRLAAGKATGVVLGCVELTDCQPDEALGVNGKPSFYRWLLASPKQLSAPLPCKGKQALWRWR